MKSRQSLKRETKISQVFIALAPSTLDKSGASRSITDEIIENLQLKKAASDGEVRYPGERVLQTRKQNLAEGIPVDPNIWSEVQSLI